MKNNLNKYRFLLFDEITTSFHCIAESSFHQHCVLRVSHLIVSSSSSSSLYQRALIISAATDGKIVFWDVTKLTYDSVCCERTKDSDDDSHHHYHHHHQHHHVDRKQQVSHDSSHEGEVVLDTNYTKISTSLRRHQDQHHYQHHDNPVDIGEPLWCHRCHQSGVNSLSIRKVSDLTYLIATGGDDNAICVLIIKLTFSDGNKDRVDVLKCHTKKDAHAAQVTARDDDDNVKDKQLDIFFGDRCLDQIRDDYLCCSSLARCHSEGDRSQPGTAVER
ncbi:hypothetical protein LSH36_452g01005 [Paralvinella palmiformis]|uniref:tRNA (34-2'-O)-methyltransferase regulator WDR6 n=1 Tax=Paralvinella palmiformis TaxID=53620 RepID=A0AAD9JAV2_9ANNE|nr:hypothetical protein LSH36_452g01005 [Paralvinella palmiformis]